jgi:hypothetical protein
MYNVMLLCPPPAAKLQPGWEPVNLWETMAKKAIECGPVPEYYSFDIERLYGAQ